MPTKPRRVPIGPPVQRCWLDNARQPAHAGGTHPLLEMGVERREGADEVNMRSAGIFTEDCLTEGNRRARPHPPAQWKTATQPNEVEQIRAFEPMREHDNLAIARDALPDLAGKRRQRYLIQEHEIWPSLRDKPSHGIEHGRFGWSEIARRYETPQNPSRQPPIAFKWAEPQIHSCGLDDFDVLLRANLHTAAGAFEVASVTDENATRHSFTRPLCHPREQPASHDTPPDRPP